MAGSLASSPPTNGVPMLRNDSEESADSPFASALNTPADDKPSNFDSTDAKFLTVGAPQTMERLETHVRGGRVDTPWGRSPRRVPLFPKFSKVMEAVDKNTSPNLNGLVFRARSNSVERLGYPEPFSSRQPSPHLISFASGELLIQPTEEPQRVQTPEPPSLDPYVTSSPQSFMRTTPRSRPPLRRDIFSLAPKHVDFDVEVQSPSGVEFTLGAHVPLRREIFPPVPKLVDFDVEDQSPSNVELTPRAHPPLRHDIFSPAQPVDFDVEDQSPSSVELTPRAHSTLRRRKREPASEVLVAADPKDAEPNDASHEVALADDELTDCDYDCEDKYSEFVVPALPQPSRLLPLQLFLLPTWASRLRLLSLAQRLIVHCLPIATPPTPTCALTHWATVAYLHVAIFLAFLVGVAYLYLPPWRLACGGVRGAVRQGVGRLFRCPGPG
ncbi:hypothetical protein MVEN_00022800 [Mycena venus]|uniref:Transmembrane protein n=1 Tax=Mycena venus TaxID=2733690 RepID=A0A8H7DFX8_9AGAR|nr:hypothetical protein MVEN_00022800 [Mycena venus]